MFVVNSGILVFGQYLFSALELKLLDGHIVTSLFCMINSADASTKPKKLGFTQGFMHLVKVCADVKPVLQN